MQQLHQRLGHNTFAQRQGFTQTKHQLALALRSQKTSRVDSRQCAAQVGLVTLSTLFFSCLIVQAQLNRTLMLSTLTSSLSFLVLASLRKGADSVPFHSCAFSVSQEVLLTAGRQRHTAEVHTQDPGRWHVQGCSWRAIQCRPFLLQYPDDLQLCPLCLCCAAKLAAYWNMLLCLQGKQLFTCCLSDAASAKLLCSCAHLLAILSSLVAASKLPS